jgi:hypothetical protein
MRPNQTRPGGLAGESADAEVTHGGSCSFAGGAAGNEDPINPEQASSGAGHEDDVVPLTVVDRCGAGKGRFGCATVVGGLPPCRRDADPVLLIVFDCDKDTRGGGLYASLDRRADESAAGHAGHAGRRCDRVRAGRLVEATREALPKTT